jgi:hypothetical protein
MTFRIEVTRTWYYVESNEVETWATDPHRTEESEMEYDSDARLEYDSPVAWAVAMLGNESIVQTPNMAGFPALQPSGSPIPDGIESHWWLSGTAADNYTNEESEWSVRLVSPEWTPEMRAEVFRRVTA